jgi:hypothetical protein
VRAVHQGQLTDDFSLVTHLPRNSKSATNSNNATEDVRLDACGSGPLGLLNPALLYMRNTTVVLIVNF